jgi:sigma-E factor negative regulatory protein RseB
VLSVFVQRGALPARLEGWRVVALGGYPVFAGRPAGRSFTWSAGGFVFTVVASAPPRTVHLAVAELPHDRGPGFFQRVRRGLKRIATWVNPFG